MKIKTYIYKMKREMYIALTRTPKEKYITKQELIDDMNENWGLRVEIKDIVFY